MITRPVSSSMNLGDASSRRDYKLLHTAVLGVFVVGIAAERVVAGRSHSAEGSVMERARAATDRTLPYAFMGW